MIYFLNLERFCYMKLICGDLNDCIAFIYLFGLYIKRLVWVQKKKSHLEIKLIGGQCQSMMANDKYEETPKRLLTL